MLSTYLQSIAKTEFISLRNDSVNIYYQQKGGGDTTLLFLHGWGINSSYWFDQLEYFSENYNVYALDLPGFGQSTAKRKNWTVEEYARDVLAFIQGLQLKNVVLIGHSMSGDIVLEIALQNSPSIIGVIGIDNFKLVGVKFSPEQMKEFTSFIDLMEKDYPKMSAAYADQYLFSPSTDSMDRNRVKQDFASADQAIAMSTLKEVMNYGANESEKLKNLNYTLYLLNSNTYPTNIDGLEKSCKSSFKVYEINATGHYPMIEKPEDFNIILDQLLKEL